jgi:general secretion pathway protein G
VKGNWPIVLFVLAILVVCYLLTHVRVAPKVPSPTEGATEQIHHFESALRRYYLDIGVYPTTEQGLQALIALPTNASVPRIWKGPYMAPPIVRRDPWNHDFVYVNPGTHNTNSYDLFSAGPDGISGSKDDIGNW